LAARVAELVDATDLKSVIRKDVGVRVPPRALFIHNMNKKINLNDKSFELIIEILNKFNILNIS
jgi:hypothetical protein